jgi:hypothetical protein
MTMKEKELKKNETMLPEPLDKSHQKFNIINSKTEINKNYHKLRKKNSHKMKFFFFSLIFGFFWGVF